MTALLTPKQQFLDAYEREHRITMRVLHAYPPDREDLRPHPRCKTARELAWVFVLERWLGKIAFDDELATGPPGDPAPPPSSWAEILVALERAHHDFGDLVRATPDPALQETVKFFTGPKTLSDVPRLAVCWLILHDQIHHRGQFSVYLRMADGKVPSIYGPSGDETWT